MSWFSPSSPCPGRTTQKSTPRPPGSMSGQWWPISPSFSLTVVRASTGPPDARPRRRPSLPTVAKIMVSSAPQLAPRGAPPGLFQSVTAWPPSTAIFFHVPSTAEKPTQRPSGDRNGFAASDTRTRDSRRSSGRMKRVAPPNPLAYTTRVPSGEIAMSLVSAPPNPLNPSPTSGVSS